MMEALSLGGNFAQEDAAPNTLSDEGYISDSMDLDSEPLNDEPPRYNVAEWLNDGPKITFDKVPGEDVHGEPPPPSYKLFSNSSPPTYNEWLNNIQHVLQRPSSSCEPPYIEFEGPTYNEQLNPVQDEFQPTSSDGIKYEPPASDVDEISYPFTIEESSDQPDADVIEEHNYHVPHDIPASVYDPVEVETAPLLVLSGEQPLRNNKVLAVSRIPTNVLAEILDHVRTFPERFNSTEEEARFIQRTASLYIEWTRENN